jgi:hypothetical protein
VNPRAGLDDVEKRKFLTLPGLEPNPSVIQSVASRYTDYPNIPIYLLLLLLLLLFHIFKFVAPIGIELAII